MATLRDIDKRIAEPAMTGIIAVDFVPVLVHKLSMIAIFH